MRLILQVWRQKSETTDGRFERYEADNLSEDMSFLEMLDVVNERLSTEGKDPIAFEHDCREGICGSCAMMINGRPHGPEKECTACQLHLRKFKDGDEVYVEPWRVRAFPIVKDLVVSRSSFDRIIAAGGYVSINTGAAPEANSVLVPKEVADLSMDAAQCIGCGACAAACPNGSAMLFTAAKVAHLNLIAQGQPERFRRALKMVEQMDEELFGACTNHGECQEACPKGISLSFITRLNRDYIAGRTAEARSGKGKMGAQ